MFGSSITPQVAGQVYIQTSSVILLDNADVCAIFINAELTHI